MVAIEWIDVEDQIGWRNFKQELRWMLDEW